MAEDAKPQKDDAKPRRILERDLASVAENLKKELSKRKSSNWRSRAELVWKEVDRQIALQEMARVARQTGDEGARDWHSVVELGELSMASELFSADIRRITFPMNRMWFDAHSKVDVTQAGLPSADEKTGQPTPVPPKLQGAVDGLVRAFMAQQHLDFGLKARVDLSVKEALHHGGYVVTVEYEHMEQFYEDSGIKRLTAPVWKAHSMWNCYPDPSPSVVGENMYYQGTMFIVTYMPWAEFKKLKGDGYWPAQLKKVTKKDSKNKDDDLTGDVEIVTYYGDVYITRGDGDIFLPNLKCQLFNDVLCYAKENDTPYLPIIYRGWERIDVRDPYYYSPIIKMSPWQKISTVLSNRYIDSIELDVEPPVTYDKNDPDMVANDGPDLSPGSKIPTGNPNTVKELQIGNPDAALAGVTFAVNHMQQALSITPQKQGQALGDRATAREVASVEQGAEVRPIHFIDQLGEALRSFLYMQHSLNLRNPKLEYEYYNPEMGQPDFMRVRGQDLPKAVHFEVVGARGLLGETERAQKLTGVAMLAEKIPPFAQLLDHQELLRQLLMDAGVKNPEALMRQEQGLPPQVQMMMQQMQQQMQQLSAALKEAESGNYVKLYKAVHDYHAKMTKIMADRHTKMAKIGADHVHGHLDRQVDLFKHLTDEPMALRDQVQPEQQSLPESRSQTQVDSTPSRISLTRTPDGGFEGTVNKGGRIKSVVIRKSASGYEGESKPVLH